MNRHRGRRRPRQKGPPEGPRGGRPRGQNEFSAEGRDLPGRLRLRTLEGNRFALLPPLCARDRVEDIEEVQKMIDAGENEIARDELLYLVADCRSFLAAHNLLAELALAEGDVSLARGHFGFAYEIGMASLPEGFRGRLPARTGYNAAFFLAGRGVARCLIALGRAAEGRDVLEWLARLDPEEPLVRGMLVEFEDPQRVAASRPDRSGREARG